MEAKIQSSKLLPHFSQSFVAITHVPDFISRKGSYYSDTPSKKVAPDLKAEKAQEVEIEMNTPDFGATYADPTTIQHEMAATGAEYAVSAKITPKKQAKASKQVSFIMCILYVCVDHVRRASFQWNRFETLMV